jgi:hypothetical protein
VLAISYSKWKTFEKLTVFLGIARSTSTASVGVDRVLVGIRVRGEGPVGLGTELVLYVGRQTSHHGRIG